MCREFTQSSPRNRIRCLNSLVKYARGTASGRGKSAVDVPLQPPVADGHGDREDQQRRAYDEGGDDYQSKDGPHRAENARLALLSNDG